MSDWGAERLVRFTPKRRDDLKPKVLPWVDGPPFRVLYSGVMDQGQYDGQTMWMPLDGPVVGWFADCDLTDAEPAQV